MFILLFILLFLLFFALHAFAVLALLLLTLLLGTSLIRAIRLLTWRLLDTSLIWTIRLLTWRLLDMSLIRAIRLPTFVLRMSSFFAPVFFPLDPNSAQAFLFLSFPGQTFPLKTQTFILSRPAFPLKAADAFLLIFVVVRAIDGIPIVVIVI
ncbi:hypothetical protein AGMMS50256_28420 [Betaproteobacteria bacterium]|nr:hypothetical protein AGMMS50256_28420 [Betaproteobacteria bacterium]